MKCASFAVIATVTVAAAGLSVSTRADTIYS